MQVNLQVPTNSLFKTHAEPTSRYLVETDPRFANYRDWLSSDYLLQQLAVDPATTQKRLGDGFYEQRLVREQLGQLTGNAYLPGYASDEDMYRALLSNGATFGKDHQLIPGVALTAEQMTQLTTDLVWLVEQEVTLADGTTQRVLVPQVYLVPRDGDLDKNGSLIAGDRVEMALSGDFVNEGTLRGGDVRIQAQNASNSGSIRGASVALTARDDLKNVGGTLAATADLSLVAGRNMDIASTTASGSIYNKTGPLTQATVLDKVASLSAGGVMVLKAGQDVTLQAAQLQQGADGNGSEGGIGVQAGRDVTLSAVKLSSDTALIKNANNYKKESVTQDSGTTVDAQGFVTVKAGQDLTATAAEIKSSEGAVTLAAGRDVQLLAGEARQVIEEMSQKKKSGFLKKKVTTTYSKTDETVAVATTVSGDTVAIMAGQDLLVKGSNVVSDAGTSLVAGGDVTIEGVTQTLNSENFSKTVKSGLMGGGGIGFTIGKQSLEQTKKNTELTSAGSTVASVQGDVSIVAGEAYKQVGSTVSAPAGDVSVLAKSIDIEGVEKEGKDVQTTSFRSSGLSLSVSAPALSALTSTVSMAQNIGKVSDSRMQALGVASTAIKAKEAVQALQADPKAAGGLSISITVGSSQSKSRTETTSTTHQGSDITAGGDIRLTAQGAGADSDIHIQGTDLAAAQRLALKAEGDVSLISAQDRVQQKSSNSSSSASVGVAVGVGSSGASIGLTASASLARGKSDGNDVIQRNTHLQGQQVSIESGGDTTLKGAVVSGDQVKVAAGGNLSIESLQDTSKFKSESMQVGGSATFGVGFSGSVSGGQSKIKSDYASVTEQSGIRAGDGGFQVEVKGHTDLKGGAITSTQAAVDAGVNSFQSGSLSLSDIQNKADYKGSSYNVSVGFGKKEEGGKKEGEAPKPTDGSYQLTVVKPGGAPGNSAGFGYSSGSDSSVTLAGISGVAGNASARTGDAETGIKPIFDKSKVQQDLAAQVAITQTFGKEATKQIGDFADSQLAKAIWLRAEANAESDPAKREELNKQAETLQTLWGSHGILRIGAHAVVGSLTGDVSGAAGAAAGAAVAPAVSTLLEKTTLNDTLLGALTAVASTGAGILAGGTSAGGVSAFNEVTNNYLNHQQVNQMLEKLRKADRQDQRDAILIEYARISAAQRAAIANCRGDECAEITKDIAQGQAALKQNLTELGRKAGFLNQELPDIISIQVDGSFKVAQQIEFNAFARERIKLFQSMNVSPSVLSAIEYGIACTTAACIQAQYESLKKIQVDASQSDKIAIALEIGYLQGRIQTFGGCLKNTGCEGIALVGQVVGAVVGGAGRGRGSSTSESPRDIASRSAGGLIEDKSQPKTCSFRGDMEVLTPNGFRRIDSVKEGDLVLGKNELGSEVEFRKVLAQYSNIYDKTVRINIVGRNGVSSTIVSNEIHPFFAVAPEGVVLPSSSEGHYYAGDIPGGAWIDAAKLEAGFQLLTPEGLNAKVQNVGIFGERLHAFNLSVEGVHTYFIHSPDGGDPIWVHNNCYDKLPSDAKAVGKTVDGRDLFSFTNSDGKSSTAYQGRDGRWYDVAEYPPWLGNTATGIPRGPMGESRTPTDVGQQALHDLGMDKSKAFLPKPETRRSSEQIYVPLTEAEAMDRIESLGYIKSTSQTGKVVMFDGPGGRYTFYGNSTGNGVSQESNTPSASLKVGETTVKIRFKK